MLQLPVLKTPWYSYCTGKISEGCQLCVQRRKLVLFITGLCGQRCFYCPVSELKFGNDVVFANETPVKNPGNPVELIEEVGLTEARGAGITGGDPLVKIERCCDYIRLLKQNFGKKFHIHLYTPLQLVSEERLKKLFDAGLDEIRFHPNLDDQALWPRLSLARKFSWKTGVEIPSIPEYEEKTKKLIDFIVGKVDFINLNELELSDTQAEHYKLAKLGYKPKDAISYGVEGSVESGRVLLKYAIGKGLPGHLCTAKLKDGIQVKRRLQFRAKHVALSFEKRTKDGLLIRACLYLEELKPGFGYRKHLKTVCGGRLLEKLTDLKNKIQKELDCDETQIVIDEKKYRLLLPEKLLKKNISYFKKQNLSPAIVQEYPTSDGFEVDIEFL